MTSLLSEVYLKVYYYDYNINSNNITTPGSLQIQQQSIPMSNTIYQKFFLEFENIVYSTDYGYVFQDIVTETYFTFNEYYGIYSNEIDDPYFFVFVAQGTSDQVTYSRT